jgi:hypothetical protein
MVQRVLMTSGSYNQYDVSDLLEGPDDPGIHVLVDAFHAAYLRLKHDHTKSGRCRVHDVEDARIRLLQEGVDVHLQAGYYGWCSSLSGADGILDAWLIAKHGYRRVAYFILHEGMSLAEFSSD